METRLKLALTFMREKWLISKDSSIALYADDSKMYRVISTQEDLSTFQSDIDKISDWCKMNKMRINTKKCKIMRITRKKSPLVGEYNHYWMKTCENAVKNM